jgi:hypothetical protein
MNIETKERRMEEHQFIHTYTQTCVCRSRHRLDLPSDACEPDTEVRVNSHLLVWEISILLSADISPIRSNYFPSRVTWFNVHFRRGRLDGSDPCRLSSMS